MKGRSWRLFGGEGEEIYLEGWLGGEGGTIIGGELEGLGGVLGGIDWILGDVLGGVYVVLA